MESWKNNIYTLSQGQNKHKALKPGLIDTKHGGFGSSAFITQFNLTYTHIAWNKKKTKQKTLVEQIVQSFSPDLRQTFATVS